MLTAPRCFERGCVHFLGVKQFIGRGEESERPFCSAFLQGIPDAIAYGNNLHETPFPGDHGIQFEVDPELADEA